MGEAGVPERLHHRRVVGALLRVERAPHDDRLPPARRGDVPPLGRPRQVSQRFDLERRISRQEQDAQHRYRLSNHGVTLRARAFGWHFGQKCVARPPTIVRVIGVPQL